MSAAVYAEPYKLPAGALALAVHAMFFALLYFGVNWRAEPPQGMVVDIWGSLPEMNIAPAKVAPPEVEQVEPPKPPEPSKLVEPPKLAEPVPPVEPPKADINLAVKKKPQAKPVEVKKPVEHKKPPVEQKPIEPKITEAEKAQQAAQAEQSRVQAEQERARAAQAAKQAAEAAAAITNEVGKYKGLIRSKIRLKIVMPPDMPDNAQAEFDVRLLPDGEVLGDPKLVKSSGHTAYDAAVERAILKAQPFALPSDMAAKKEFLNPNKLLLKFSPKE